MTDALARNWWALALHGLVAVLFGLVAFIWPALTLGALVILFGAYVLVDGVFAIVTAVRAAGRGKRWWPLVLEGGLGIAAGIITFLWPGLATLGLLFIIAAWAIITGSLEIVAAIWLRREITGEWLLALGGAASVVFGLLFFFPGAGVLALAWLIEAYALLFGVLLIALGFRLRDRQERPNAPVTA